MTDLPRHRISSVVAPALVYATAAVVVTWPLAEGLRTAVLSTGPFFHGDILLVVWATTWSAHALTNQPTQLFDANTFHPSHGVLAGSEHFAGTLPLFVPAWAATANPAFAFNVTVLASLVLCGLGVHLLVLRWTGDRLAAYLAGLAFLAAPWRRLVLGTAPHVNAVGYLPFVLLWLDDAMRGGRVRPALLAAVALALQIACSYYLGYLALALVGCYVAANLLGTSVHGRARALGAAALAVGGGLALVAPVTLPYLAYVGARRPSVFPEEIQYQQAFRSWASVVGSPTTLAAHYVGLGVLVLALGTVLTLPRLRREDRDGFVRVLGLAFAVAVAFLLAPGTGGFFGGAIVPHEWISQLVPGFDRVRYASRFGVLASFAASVLAGLAVARVRVAWPARRAFVVVAAALALDVATRRPVALALLPVPSGDAIPAVHRWLAADGDGAPVLELPTGYDIPGMTTEAWAAYFSLFHRLPVLNGVTGYVPPGSWFLKREWLALPSPEALRLLVGCTGLRWIVVHAPSPARAAAWAALPGVRLRETFARDAGGSDLLYEVADPTPSGCAERLERFDVTADGHLVRRLARLDGRLAVEGLPDTAPAGSERAVTVVLENHGGETWPATAIGSGDRFALEVRWEPIGVAGAAKGSEERLALPADVLAGGTARATVWLAVPPEPGRYRITVRAGQGDFPSPPSTEPAPLRWDGVLEVRPS